MTTSASVIGLVDRRESMTSVCTHAKKAKRGGTARAALRALLLSFEAVASGR